MEEMHSRLSNRERFGNGKGDGKVDVLKKGNRSLSFQPKICQTLLLHDEGTQK